MVTVSAHKEGILALANINRLYLNYMGFQNFQSFLFTLHVSELLTTILPQGRHKAVHGTEILILLLPTLMLMLSFKII